MIIDGNKIKEDILRGLKDEVGSLGFKLGLAAVLVGDDPGSKKFLELKGEAAREIGANFVMHEFPEEISTEDLVKEIVLISEAKENSGVIIELPLPAHINSQEVLDAIPLDKDVDVLSTEAQNLFFDNKSKILPPAVEAVKIILEENDIGIEDKNVVVFGHGFLVGKPITHWSKNNGAKVSVVDEFTENPEEISKKADIIISGVGKTDLIKENMVKDGVVIIDFGFNRDSGKIKGDVDTLAYEKASFFTPVPGGVGPVVVAAALKNLVELS